ncbi:hypothetical protein OC835_003651 [Tilletia horrida]|nr:hypothetical protein OC835_003651 [Tilletia horrida]
MSRSLPYTFSQNWGLHGLQKSFVVLAGVSTEDASTDFATSGERFSASLTFAALAVVLLLVLWYDVRGGRRIRLPKDDGDQAATAAAAAAVGDDDIVAASTEAILSEPVQEEQYLATVRQQRNRLLVLGIASVALAVSTTVELQRQKAPFSATLSLQADGLLWIAILALLLTPLRTQGRWVRILQLNTLLLVSLTTHTLRILVPPPLAWDDETQRPIQLPALFRGPLLWQQAAAAILAFAAWLTNARTPSGPQRIMPSPQPGTIPTSAVLADDSAGASLLSFLFFSYCFPVIKASWKKGQLSPDDVPFLSDRFRASRLFFVTQLALTRLNLKEKEKDKDAGRKDGENAEKAAKRAASRRAWRLLKTLFSTNKTVIIPMFFSTILAAMSFYLPWVLLWLVINSFERSERNNEPIAIAIRQNIVYAVALAVGQILQTLIVSGAWSLSVTSLRVRFRNQLSVLLLNKSLRRKDTTTLKEKEDDSSKKKDGEEDKEEQDEATGDDPAEFATKSKIITLQTVDIQRVEEFSLHFFVMFNCPVELITGGILAYKVLGVSALIGLAMSFVTAPIVWVITRRIEKVQEKLMASRDSRSSYMNESFQAIRMIKFAGWERRVIANIMKARKAELSYQRKQYLLDACSEFLFFLSPMLVIIAAFTCYTVVFGNKLTPSRAFTAFQVLQELRWALTQLPDTLSSAIQSWTSLKRIATYLDCAEVEVPESQDLTSEAARGADREVRLQNATIGWPVVVAAAQSSSPAGSVVPNFRLRDVTVEFSPNRLNLICGKLGSGKSLLLQGLLGEADLLVGSIKCPRSTPDAIAQSEDPRIYARGEWISPLLTAYVPQSAFLTNNSLRNNILFGLPMIRERYDAVLDACALLPDLAIFEDGDEVEIGEGGIGLSGGQKARVSLARAVYSRAQTLLLDDILSAVDAHTAAHIHKNLLQGPLLKDRTVLLVSHQVQLVAPSAALVLVLDNGAIKYQGQSSDFLSSQFYRGLIEEVEEADKLPAQTKDKQNDTQPASKEKAESDALFNGRNKAEGETDNGSKAPPRKLVEDEARNVGAIGLQTWKRYLQMAGGYKLLPVLIALIVPSLWTLLSSWWLRAFSADAGAKEGSKHPVSYWMFGYSALVLIECVLHFIKWLFAYWASLRASRVIFESALTAVFRAPMRFHDTVPRGRLLNRFTNDQEEVDSSLASNLVIFIDQSVSLIFSIVAVCIGGGPKFLIVVAILAPFYFYTAKVFAGAARDIRRLHQTAKSAPIQTFADIVNGVAVVRAFGASANTLNLFFQQTDNNARYAYFNRQCARWMNALYALVTATLYFFATVFIMLSGANAALAAFALSFLLNIGHTTFFAVMCYSENETKGVAVERLVEYTDVASEAAPIIEPRPPASWPHAGQVSFENLRLRYAPELPEVLKGVTFDIAAGQKVGIVGPTGCGKSTTVTSLFRLVDNFSGGRIVIDSIDISKIGLEDLRSRLMIVPQDPVILSGSLRDSIDVFHEHSDEDIIAALKKVHLIGSANANASSLSRVAPCEGTENEQAQNLNVFEDLTYTIAESGSNLSNGQRQLLCMARALLGRSKVVVFDEASSSVDQEADDLITATLQEEFADCTVITIAHRLRTIMHSDRVVVMDKGAVVEYASPAELLQRPESHFYKLCAASGKAEFEKLREMAGLPGSSSTATSSKAPSIK